MVENPSQPLLPAGEFPDAAAIAALRAWHEGLSAREAVMRYMGAKKADGQSSRAMLARVRRQLALIAQRRRPDLEYLFVGAAADRVKHARKAAEAIEALRRTPVGVPLVTDTVDRWLPSRAARALQAHGIRTLAELTVRVPRRRRWWAVVPGLGQAGARGVEAFFALHPTLTQSAAALVTHDAPKDIVPWELLAVPSDLDGSRGSFRAPRASCVLAADDDYQAVDAWLALHESTATQRSYRKEAERLILWAILECDKPLSSLRTEDAVAYRKFLRHPSPRSRWVGPAISRSSSEWRPFTGDLSSNSVAYALSVLNALFRWLIEQRYVLANPFSGVKARGASSSGALDASRSFTDGEWALVRAVAEGLEWSYGWSAEAAQRLRFVLDFGYSTGLRGGELIGQTLGHLKVDGQGDWWLHLVGKGEKLGRVAVPQFARAALDRNLAQRGLPTTPSKWNPRTPLISSLSGDGAGITAGRLRAVLARFFEVAARTIEKDAPAVAEKLRRATPHWLRHTHASHALQQGVELTAVRDNLRHATISTTSLYLHADDARRSRQMDKAFAPRQS